MHVLGAEIVTVGWYIVEVYSLTSKQDATLKALEQQNYHNMPLYSE